MKKIVKKRTLNCLWNQNNHVDCQSGETLIWDKETAKYKKRLYFNWYNLQLVHSDALLKVGSLCTTGQGIPQDYSKDMVYYYYVCNQHLFHHFKKRWKKINIDLLHGFVENKYNYNAFNVNFE